jgi:hypothetical protein
MVKAWGQSWRAQVGFMVDKRALDQVFLPVCQFSLSVSFHQCCCTQNSSVYYQYYTILANEGIFKQKTSLSLTDYIQRSLQRFFHNTLKIIQIIKFSYISTDNGSEGPIFMVQFGRKKKMKITKLFLIRYMIWCNCHTQTSLHISETPEQHAADNT